MKYFFQAVSILLHPLLMPVLGLLVLFESKTIPNSLVRIDALCYFPADVKKALYIVLGILTIIAPGVSLLIMRWNRMISDLELSNRKERFYPYLLIIFYYALAFSYLKLRLPPVFQHPALMSFVFGIILVFVVSFFLNFYVKVSMHAAGIFGVCGAVLAYDQSQIQSNFPFLIYLICVGGLVATSRIYIGAHTLRESLAGMAVGFFVLFFSVKYNLFM